MRGRRRIGKSSLVAEFVDRAGVPAVFFTAAGASAEVELEALQDAVASSTVPDRSVFTDAVPGNWSAALRQLAGILPDDQPSVVVIDEVPYLMDRVDAFEGVLQRAWDRELSRRPVLLVLIGSDLSMMEALGSYGRPFHQRGQEMVLGPLNPAEVGQMLELEPAAAFDAALVTGGLPLICAAWQRGDDMWAFLERELANPVSALLVSAERSLAAEFPDSANARRVLSAIGSGERTFTNIARAVGGIAPTSLTRSTDVLLAKRMVVGELPLSTRPSKERRYRVADPSLRFWLRFIGPHLPEIERLRGDLTLRRIRDGWTAWRGRDDGKRLPPPHVGGASLDGVVVVDLPVRPALQHLVQGHSPFEASERGTQVLVSVRPVLGAQRGASSEDSASSARSIRSAIFAAADTTSGKPM